MLSKLILYSGFFKAIFCKFHFGNNIMYFMYIVYPMNEYDIKNQPNPTNESLWIFNDKPELTPNIATKQSCMNNKIKIFSSKNYNHTNLILLFEIQASYDED